MSFNSSFESGFEVRLRVNRFEWKSVIAKVIVIFCTVLRHFGFYKVNEFVDFVKNEMFLVDCDRWVDEGGENERTELEGDP
jgi:hypothetical protein